MPDISRVVERDPSTELASMAIMLYSLPRVEKYCDALVVYPGMGETWRLEQIIFDWQKPSHCATRHLFIAGKEWHKEASAVRPPIIENLMRSPYCLVRTEGVHAQDHARHTRDQAEWVVSLVQMLGVRSLALYVSPYHLLRACLTLLKTFISMKVQWIPIVPVPIAVPPNRIIPETNTDAWSLVQGEMARIKAYQEKGDVATLKELQEYLAWIWGQEPICYRAF